MGKPLKHKSADKQATGEALYLDDLPAFKNELYLAFVTSQKAHAKILSLDFSEAEKAEGYKGHVMSINNIFEQFSALRKMKKK